MTDLELALTTLVGLLCRETVEKQQQIDRLTSELHSRPTREQLHATEQRALRAGDEVQALKRQVEDLKYRIANPKKKRRP